MPVTTIEGIVKDGRIQLSEDIKLPESAKVYIVVPALERKTARIMSPRLVNKSDAKRFVKTIEVDDEIR
jgi:hypothetical protein